MRPALRPLPAEGVPEVVDEELIARMAAGDSGAMTTFYHRHQRGLHGFVRRILGRDGDDLDDAVQNAFVAAYRSAARFRGESSGRTWLFAIATNVVRTQRRSALRRLRALTALAWEPRPAASSPAEVVERDHDLALVADAIGELSHDLRVAYVMHVIEGLAADEVGAALGVPRGTIWRRVHEARLELRRALEAGARS